MTRTILFLGLALVLGCAAGQPAALEDASAPPDAGVDRVADVSAPADGEAADGVAPADGAPDAASDTAPPQSDAGQDVGCPAGHTGASCAECLPNLYQCDQDCVASCASCNGMPATCSSPKECMTRCTSCGASCVDCPTGYHLCPTSCVADGADVVATGCKYTCDSQPCAPPAHATAVCTGGNCDFTCDAAGHWVKSGAACVCDGGAGFVEDQGTCVCDASANLKLCSGACVATTTANGCADASCTACPAPAHATAFCNGGGSCDFTCDAAGHWVKSGAACVCDSGYTEQCDTCVGGAACPGTYDCATLHCYWYVATAATFDAAEAACVAQSAHLVSIGDAAENSFVLGLAAADCWIGLKDHATVRQSASPDDCTDNAWIDSNGGTYTGSTSSAYDDYDACNSSSSDDVIFSIDIQAAGIWIFSLSNSSFDTVLGLYSRAGGGGYTGCVGSQLACDDDGGSGTRSKIARDMAVGQYAIIVDGYDDYSYGSFSLDVRRFQWNDGTANTYNNWKSEEPNNSSTNEYCVEMYKSSSAGQWNDLTCSSSLPYVCERAF